MIIIQYFLINAIVFATLGKKIIAITCNMYYNMIYYSKKSAFREKEQKKEEHINWKTKNS